MDPHRCNARTRRRSRDARASEISALRALSRTGAARAVVRPRRRAIARLDPGAVDGVMGPATQRAIRSFQRAEMLDATRQQNSRTLVALGLQETGTATQRSAYDSTLAREVQGSPPRRRAAAPRRTIPSRAPIRPVHQRGRRADRRLLRALRGLRYWSCAPAAGASGPRRRRLKRWCIAPARTAAVRPWWSTTRRRSGRTGSSCTADAGPGSPRRQRPAYSCRRP